MPRSSLIPPLSRASKCPPFLAGALAVAALLSGCGSDAEDTAETVYAYQTAVETVASGTGQAQDPNAPLTAYEQRRLIARIQADPQHQLQRLSARERRGLAAMAAATKKKKDGDED